MYGGRKKVGYGRLAKSGGLSRSSDIIETPVKRPRMTASENLFDETFGGTMTTAKAKSTVTSTTPAEKADTVDGGLITPLLTSECAPSDKKKVGKSTLLGFFKTVESNKSFSQGSSSTAATAAASATSTSILKADSSQQKAGVDDVTQMYLDFGQKSFGRRTNCSVCGMMFDISIEEERKDHDKVGVNAIEAIAQSEMA